MTENNGVGAYRTNDPDTSIEAAAAVNVTEAEKRCYDLCVNRGAHGVTNSEAANLLKVLPNATSPRWRPMARKCLVCDSSKRRRNTVSGRNEIVWVAI